MTRAANIQTEQFAEAEIKSSLLGRKCWYAYCSVGNTFKIALGRKVARDAEDLAMRAKLAERRKKRGIETARDSLAGEWDKFCGESELLVWCSWRLDDSKGPVTSWDDQAKRCEEGIRRLIGHAVRSVEIGSGWNLRLDFAGGLVLSVLPDHVGPNASFDGNWELWRPDQAYLIGTNLECEVIDRQNRTLALRDRHGRWVVRSKQSRRSRK